MKAVRSAAEQAADEANFNSFNNDDDDDEPSCGVGGGGSASELVEARSWSVHSLGFVHSLVRSTQKA